MMWRLCFLRNFRGSILLCCFIFAVNLLCNASTSDMDKAQGILIANTMDGSFVGLDIITGDVVWIITGPPLVSQSLSDLQLLTKTKGYNIVPSLDGQLFLMERNVDAESNFIGNASLKALPLTIDSLFSSNFMLTEDSILTGGRDHSTFAFNPLTGKVKYNCTRDGCVGYDEVSTSTSKSIGSAAFTIVVYRVNNIVRAVNAPLGIEKWNLSVLEHNLCLLTGHISKPVNALQHRSSKCGLSTGIFPGSTDHNTEFLEPYWEFSLDKLLVKAKAKDLFSKELWSRKLSSRISKAWIFRTDLHTLRPISLFTHDQLAVLMTDKLEINKKSSHLSLRASAKAAVNLFSKKPFTNSLDESISNCPSRDRLIYLGDMNGQFYVQVEDGLDSPTLDMIHLSKTLNSHLAAEENNIATVSSEMVGYYRATYTKPINSPVKSNQPFLNYNSNVEMNDKTDKRKQTSISDSPSINHNIYTPLLDYLPSQSSDGIINKPISESDPTEEDGHFVDHVFDSANDLLMLLLRASENVVSHHAIDGKTNGNNFTIFLIQFSLLTFVLYFTARWIMIARIEFETRLEKSQATSENVSNLEYVTVNEISSPNILAITNQNLCSTPKIDKSVHPFSSSLLESPIKNELNVSTSFISTFEVDFKFIRRLGRGGFGQVFEVENRLDGCRYAIKRIKMSLVDDDKAKFLREVRALATLDHPGIVRYHRAWEEYPPIGWQESRDKEFLNEESTDFTQTESTNFNEESNFNSSFDAHSDQIRKQCIPKLGNPLRLNGSNSSGFSSSKFGLINEDSFPIDNSIIIFQEPSDNIHKSINHSDNINNSSLMSSSLLSQDHFCNNNNNNNNNNKQIQLKSNCYLYIQMQLCSPLSLRDWLSAHDKPNLRPNRSHLYFMFRQIVEAVAYLHANSLMHRDLKPSNILFDLTNRLKLADFGLVTPMFKEDLDENNDINSGNTINDSDHNEFDNSQSSTNQSDKSISSLSTHYNNNDIECSPKCSKYLRNNNKKPICSLRRHTDHVGTDLYMSPEQERGDRYDHKVDIFSLGLIFLELMITFETTMERIITLTRAKQQTLPVDFTTAHTDEAEFALCLLDIVPSNRPSAAEIASHTLLKLNS